MNALEIDRENTLAEEKTLSFMLEKVAQLSPMGDYLQDGIESLINNIPYLNLLPQGGIFLSEKNANMKRLHLMAQFKLSPEVLQLCEYVDYGHCLCGRAAQTRSVQYAGNIDQRHDVIFNGMEPHGHYNIPILSNDNLLGVLVLYLPEGHQQSEKEIAFLLRISNVFSLGITLRKTVTELDKARSNAVKLVSIANNSRNFINQFLLKTSLKLRGSIHGVLGLSQALIDTGLDEEQDELARAIISNGNILKSMIQEFEDFSEITSENIKAKEYIFNINDVFNNISTYFEAISTDKKLNLEISVAPSVPNILYGSPKLIERVIINLLNNAVEYSNNDGVIRVTIEEPSQANDTNCFVLSVEDSGTGISPDILKDLFKSFSEHGSTETSDSTGIGLFICQELLDLVGGDIWVESEVGKGSKFLFSLCLKVG